MSDTKNIYQRLASVKEIITELEITKEGKNAAINRKIQKNGKTISVAYSYFTLDGLIRVITPICSENGILTNFLLLEDSFGLYGLLTITNIDNPSEKIEIIHRTGISSENKMMNKTQQYGSVSTYSHRYLLQHTFGIVDNELDPDNEKFYNKDKSINQYDGDNNQQQKPQTNGTLLINQNQVKEFYAVASTKRITPERIGKLLSQYNIVGVENIPSVKFQEILNRMKAVQ